MKYVDSYIGKPFTSIVVILLLIAAVIFNKLSLYFVVVCSLFIAVGYINLFVSYREEKVPLSFDFTARFIGRKAAFAAASLFMVLFTVFFISVIVV